MPIAESLRAMGVDTGTLKAVIDGVNKLLLPKEQKLSLLARYEEEEGATIPPELMALVS